MHDIHIFWTTLNVRSLDDFFLGEDGKARKDVTASMLHPVVEYTWDWIMAEEKTKIDFAS